MRELSKSKIVLGLSGGVDSTTAALLLKQRGFDVTGIYFDTAGNNKTGLADAKKVAEQLGIELHHVDVSKMFGECVIENFCSEYVNGRTPNPCVICNPGVKFKTILKLADEIGAYYIATGHYARMVEEDGKYYIGVAANQKKDQSYMLCRLGQDVLSRLVFPLGEIEDKNITRDIARESNLDNADIADSQEICFIDESKIDYQTFIRQKGFRSPEGDFIDVEGNVIGRHKGILNYTIGQRKGLGVTFGKPMFVLSMDRDSNTITLGDNQDLFSREVVSYDNFFTATGENCIPNNYKDGMMVKAKIRYAAKPSNAVLYQLEGGRIKAVFDEAQRAATPGQTMAFYKDNRVIGGGFIEK